VKKKELDNLILNEIFGFGKDPSSWKEKDFKKFEVNLLRNAPDVELKNPRISAGKWLSRVRQGVLGLKDFPTYGWDDIFTDEQINRIGGELRVGNFKDIANEYRKRFTDPNKERPVKAGVVKPHKIGAKKDSSGEEEHDLPARAKKKGELRPASGELKPVAGDIRPVPGELKPVVGDIRPAKAGTKAAPKKAKQSGTSLRLDPKRLSDEKYVKEFARLVRDYTLLSPKDKVETEKQISKMLDLKKEMNDLMKQRIPGAKELQMAIRDEIAPLQRRMQQIAENLVKQNFEQVIREELGNYIKEKK
jgi:hypothetical protein